MPSTVLCARVQLRSPSTSLVPCESTGAGLPCGSTAHPLIQSTIDAHRPHHPARGCSCTYSLSARWACARYLDLTLARPPLVRSVFLLFSPFTITFPRLVRWTILVLFNPNNTIAIVIPFTTLVLPIPFILQFFAFTPFIDPSNP